MADYDVLAIGELNADLIVTGLNSMPIPGREIIAEDFSLVMGSSTAICACGCARLGLSTAFCGKVGQDRFGEVVLEGLAQNGVALAPVIIEPGLVTGLTISLSDREDRALVTVLGSIAALRFQDINLNLVTRTRHIHVGSFFLQHGLRPGLAELFRYARSKGVTTSLDAGWDDSGEWNGGIWEVLPYTDIIFPNEIEAQKLTGQPDVYKSLAELSRYPGITVIKRGSMGAIGQWGSRTAGVPAFKIVPVDTTGAGDSFNAGFLFGYLNGYDLERSLAYGNACGALCACRVGGATACPGIKEVEEMMNGKA